MATRATKTKSKTPARRKGGPSKTKGKGRPYRAECEQSNGIVEKRHTRVPIGRPVGGGRPGRRDPDGPSPSYKRYIESRRARYGLSGLGKREEAAKERREKERREARLKKANAEASRRRESQKRKGEAHAKRQADEKARKEAAAKRAEDSIRRKSERLSRKLERQARSDRGHAARGHDLYERESAMEVYRRWSIGELRSEARDHGISDDRKDWKKMSREQLAVWLYRHRGSAQRHYYGYRGRSDSQARQ